MSKSTVENSLVIDMKKLRKWGYLVGYSNGTLQWSWGGYNESTISFTVSTGSVARTGEIHLRYAVTDRWTKEKVDYDYKVQLTAAPCRFGGKRWGFICPLSTKGRNCGRRVYKLYSSPRSGYFGCRHCMDLSYNERQSHNARFDRLARVFKLEREIEKVRAEIKRPYYNSRPTKKYHRLLRLQREFDYYTPSALIEMENLLFR